MIDKLNNNKLTTSLASGAATLGFLAGMGIATPAQAQILPDQAEIRNIEVENTAGPVQINNQSFIPVGHFSLPTLDVEEMNIGTGGFPGGREGVAWWDLEIVVTRNVPQPGRPNDAWISIDKDVFNNGPVRWDDFHLTLGTGLGAGFVESPDNDNLFFKLDPPPVEELGAFQNPPLSDFDLRPTDTEADNLWWFANPPAGFPGVPPGAAADFWLSFNVPGGLFSDDDGDGIETARFTLREHATTPEPSTLLGLMTIGSLGLFIKRKKQ
jgi:hypothetical protein